MPLERKNEATKETHTFSGEGRNLKTNQLSSKYRKGEKIIMASKAPPRKGNNQGKEDTNSTPKLARK